MAISWLGGCASILALTRTGATDQALQAGAAVLGGQGATVEAAMRADLCRRAWRAQTYSNRDTAETVTEFQANNAARDAYCGAQR